jgi:restriction system protein
LEPIAGGPRAARRDGRPSRDARPVRHDLDLHAEAIAFGEANGIKLHDMASLLALIATRTPQQQQALLDVALEGEYWRPSCASCGVKRVERAPKAGSSTFWGCVNFPKCRTTMVKRAGRALDSR